MRRILACSLFVAIVASAAACGSDDSSSSSGRQTITLLTHDSFAVSKSVLAAFTTKTGIHVKIDKSAGDAGSALSQAILTKSHPIADAFYGLDNTFLSRALDEGIFDEWSAEGLDRVPESLQLDPSHHVTPIDYGDVCVNYDKEWFASHDHDARRGHSPIWQSPRTATSPWSRSPRRRRRGSRSSSPRSRATATTGGRTTGGRSAPTGCSWNRAGNRRTTGSFTAGGGKRDPTDRRVVRVEPAGRRRVLRARRSRHRRSRSWKTAASGRSSSSAS